MSQRSIKRAISLPAGLVRRLDEERGRAAFSTALADQVEVGHVIADRGRQRLAERMSAAELEQLLQRLDESTGMIQSAGARFAAVRDALGAEFDDGEAMALWTTLKRYREARRAVGRLEEHLNGFSEEQSADG